uniref:Uncharacterized protein n=1 Tax=Moniliophthora roreri TaxID=221103 RepID=A0A0W0FS11_MONRR
MDPPPVVIVFLSTWMRVSLDIKIKQWKWHWQNTILCFPDKVKQFKKDVKRERKITPDDYECSTFNCAPQVKILVFNPGVDLWSIRESGEGSKCCRPVPGSKRPTRQVPLTPVAHRPCEPALTYSLSNLLYCYLFLRHAPHNVLDDSPYS